MAAPYPTSDPPIRMLQLSVINKFPGREPNIVRCRRIISDSHNMEIMDQAVCSADNPDEALWIDGDLEITSIPMKNDQSYQDSIYIGQIEQRSSLARTTHHNTTARRLLSAKEMNEYYKALFWTGPVTNSELQHQALGPTDRPSFVAYVGAADNSQSNGRSPCETAALDDSNDAAYVRVTCKQNPTGDSLVNDCCYQHLQISLLEASGKERAPEPLRVVVDCQVLHPDNGTLMLANASALLDTGADVSLMSSDAAKRGGFDGVKASARPFGPITALGTKRIFFAHHFLKLVTFHGDPHKYPVVFCIIPENIGWCGFDVVFGRDLIEHAGLLKNGTTNHHQENVSASPSNSQ